MTKAHKNIRVEDKPALRNAIVQVILKDGKIVGKIIGAYPKDGAGILYVNLFDWSNLQKTKVQTGIAKGYGYDKLSHALADLTFNNLTFTDHPNNYVKQLQDNGYELFLAN